MAGNKIKGITIEIGGDTKKLDKSLNEAKKQSGSLESELKKVNKQLKFDPKNTELLTQKQKILTDSVSSTRDKLDLLKQKQAEVQTQFEKGEVSEERYRSLQREIEYTEQRLGSLTDEFKEFGSVGAQQVADVGKGMQSVGNKITDVGEKVSVLSAAAAGGLVGVGKMASDFDDNMAKVSTIADTSQKSMDTLRREILDLSNETGIAAEEIADATYNAISAGQSTADAVNFVRNATSLAKAGFADTGASIDLLTTIMNAYHLEASEVGKVSDMLIQTQNKGKTTVAELSSSMGKIIPTANSMHVGLEQITTGYSIMTANGIATAESTTYMNSMLNELGKSGTKVSDALKEETGKSFQELMGSGKSLGDVLGILKQHADETGQGFNDLWSSAEAGKAGATLLSGGVDEFNNAVKEMEGSVGATESAKEKLETNSEKAKIALNQIKNSGIDLGSSLLTALAPSIDKIVGKVQELTTWFSGLSEGSKTAILIVTGIVAAIGPLLVIIGKVVSAVGTVLTFAPQIVSAVKTAKTVISGLFTTLSANPIGIVIAAIAALIAIFVSLYKNNEKFRNFVNSIWAKIKEIFGKLPEWFKNTFESIKNAVKTKLDAVKATFSNIGNAISGTVSNMFAKIKGFFSNGLSSILSTVGGKLSTIASTFKSKIDGIKNTVKSGLNKVKGFFSGLKLKLPHINLPHFKLKGSFSIKPPSVPTLTVDWYAKAMDNGMILNQPTIFGINSQGQPMGAGEAGSETIVGTGSLMDMIRAAVRSEVGRINLQMFLDGKTLVAETAGEMDVALGKIAIGRERGN